MKMMECAREKHLEELPFPKNYQVGKLSATDVRSGTVCEIEGPGVLTRFWTTHSPGQNVKMYLYVDDSEQPTLHGYIHELAAAAGRISNAQIPLGGALLDGSSCTFYLPIMFDRNLRIDIEIVGEIKDGTYWQIDYMKEVTDRWPPLLQKETSEGIDLSYQFPEEALLPSECRKYESADYTIEVSGCAPNDPVFLDGPAVIRKIELTSEALDKLGLRIAFDGTWTSEKRMDGPFQVNAPLRYLVGKINSACIERLGPKAIIHFPMPFRQRAGIQLLTMLDEGDFRDKYKIRMRIFYEREPEHVEQMYYFHAQYACSWTNGVDDFECCSIQGNGHFVGAHIFDSGHNHGGGDNIFFDAESEGAGQLHGICGEDYFHHAYHYVGALLPYAGCPTHGDRYRHHIEMPVPFKTSFVFNWGTFAGQAPKAVSFWYQEKPLEHKLTREMTYRITGPFRIEDMDKIAPGKPLPDKACLNENQAFPRKTWVKRSQRGFVDLCHIHRNYDQPYSHSYGFICTNICTHLETSVWASRKSEVEFLIGRDDPIRVYLNGALLFRDEGSNESNPFALFKQRSFLDAGLNKVEVVVGNTPSTNWSWNGFSLVISQVLQEEEGAEVFFME